LQARQTEGVATQGDAQQQKVDVQRNQQRYAQSQGYTLDEEGSSQIQRFFSS
jgi:hypothetical protein